MKCLPLKWKGELLLVKEVRFDAKIGILEILLRPSKCIQDHELTCFFVFLF